ncbi:MAG: hypothetical protein NTV01_03020 [Bacteroidia bacterium]|nr:hypothetical protein [Bacteroidia bacterium]
MKTFTRYNRLFWSLIALSIWLNGCSEDASLVKPGSPIPVVYGVFDLNQSVHYVKLSKSFAGKSDAYTLALNHDLIFYSDAQVFLTAGSGTSRIPFQLETDVPRLPGKFPEYPNESFVLKQKLQPGDYLLTVILPSENDTLTARFTFINTFKVITPKVGFRRFYFYEDPIQFSWSYDSAAGLYEITLNLKYEEWLNTGESKICSVSYTRQLNLGDLEFENNRYLYGMFSDSFFAHLGTSILKDPAVYYRKPVGLELLITAADISLARYLNWFKLEIDDKVNPNGNVQGAIGVVGTKYSIPFPDLVLSPRSQDSLVRGRYTKKLDFVNNPDW